jgi:hypothetical protein
MDGDSDLDIVLTRADGSLRFLWNDGNGAGNRIRLDLVGTRGDRDGLGSRIEIYSGTYRRTFPVIDTDPSIPLGDRKRIDALTITWPSGIVQSVTQPAVAPGGILSVTETPAVLESCPSLYVETENGMEYATDLLGTSALGLLTGPDSYYLPDPKEILKIEGVTPAVRDGKIQLVMAQELCEIVYLDSVAVRVVDHPADVTLVSDLRFSPGLPPTDRVLPIRNLTHPVSARTPAGRNAAESLAARDLASPGDFRPLRTSQYSGLAEPYRLELDFGPAENGNSIPILIAYGYSEWPAENLALALLQHDGYDLDMPTVEVINGNGEWERVPGELAFPALKPKTIALPLPAWRAGDARRVRICTNLITHWDEIALGELDPGAGAQATTLAPESAVLARHGYSQPIDPNTRGPNGRIFHITSDVAPWGPIPGLYSAFGEVTPRLLEADDDLVIYGPGEAVALEFPAEVLPELPAGWTRDFFLVTEGWTKGNSYATGGSGNTWPVPYRGMTQYPYEPSPSEDMTAPDTDLYPRLVTDPTWAGPRPTGLEKVSGDSPAGGSI